jgi:tetratricopeptide (TPR) repeat protein
MNACVEPNELRPLRGTALVQGVIIRTDGIESIDRLSGATPGALVDYQRALNAFQTWHASSSYHLKSALGQAPGFVMAHALAAYLMLGSRDPRVASAARPVLEHTAALPANDRERQHLAAIASVLDDDYEGAKARLTEILRSEPRDALALQVAHSLDYLTGDIVCMRQRVASILPAWSIGMAGYPTVLAMHAFGLEESGSYADAERAARVALRLNPANARAHHVMAHVYEMTDRPEAGEQWLRWHEAYWAVDTGVATHCWWHLALFQLGRNNLEGAIETYDRHIRGAERHDVADLIDASALLWRAQLQGGDPGIRWIEIAQSWATHIDDRFCSFNDLHAMLSFIGAGDEARVRDLERTLNASQALATRHGQTTCQVGLPACRALLAFGRGDDARAIALLAGLPASAHRLGGSHAQRDVLNLTLLHAIKRSQRSNRTFRKADTTEPYAPCRDERLTPLLGGRGRSDFRSMQSKQQTLHRADFRFGVGGPRSRSE